jgi:hypothetical protein
MELDRKPIEYIFCPAGHDENAKNCFDATHSNDYPGRYVNSCSVPGGKCNARFKNVYNKNGRKETSMGPTKKIKKGSEIFAPYKFHPPGTVYYVSFKPALKGAHETRKTKNSNKG